MPNQKISDVHAISANIHNYQYLGLFRNFSRFYIFLITVHVVILIFPRCLHRHPALRDCCQGHAPFTAIGSASVANVRKKTENLQENPANIYGHRRVSLSGMENSIQERWKMSKQHVSDDNSEGALFFPCPERFYRQACWLKLAGLPVKSRRPAKFTPPAGPSEGGRKEPARRRQKHDCPCQYGTYTDDIGSAENERSGLPFTNLPTFAA